MTKLKRAQPAAAKATGNKKDGAPLGRLVRRSADQIFRRLGYPIPESASTEVAA